MVQQFIAKVVAYAFCTDEAIRMIAFSNPQATNLSSDRFPAHTVHRACCMRVQKLTNSTMSPGNKRSELEGFWEPARVTVAEEITMWPAEVFNMGLLRSAWGRRNKCNLDMDAYKFKRNLLCIRGESVLARVFTCWLKRNRYWVKSIRTNWGNLQTSKLDNPTPLLPPRLDYSALSRSR